MRRGRSTRRSTAEIRPTAQRPEAGHRPGPGPQALAAGRAGRPAPGSASPAAGGPIQPSLGPGPARAVRAEAGAAAGSVSAAVPSSGRRVGPVVGSVLVLVGVKNAQ
ncbi:hypothetical protein ACG83_09700 [Frankia sp. R43]|nr:hypothetical protein ACG83_09700 [Frankia sp. R43]